MGGLELRSFLVEKAGILTDCVICGHGVATIFNDPFCVHGY